MASDDRAWFRGYQLPHKPEEVPSRWRREGKHKHEQAQARINKLSELSVSSEAYTGQFGLDLVKEMQQ